MTKTLDIDMTGKLALVTGATGGIGKEIARGLAELGATVVVGARDPGRGASTVREIATTTGNNAVSAMTLDVASQSSIRAFVAAFRQRYDRLDVLVNNAGAWFTERLSSPDGRELTLATNVLGPFLLTELLLESLRAANHGRIVNIVSALASNYDVNDLEFTRRKFSGFKVYSQSKQALRMLTWGLATRLEGSGITVNAASPGFVRSGFNRHAKGMMAMMIGLSARLMAVSTAEGADTPLWAAVAPELEGVTGRYFEDRKEKDGRFRDQGPIAELEQRCRMLSDPVRPAAATESSARA